MRAREAGIAIGLLEPGPANGITDVAGVAVTLNGAGELTGLAQVREWGVAETPTF